MGKASRRKCVGRANGKIPSGPMCDVCALPPKWIFPTRSYHMLIGDTMLVFHSWGVCNRCALLIEQRDFEGLADSGAEMSKRRFGKMPSRELLLQCYRLMDANRIGPKEEWHVDKNMQ